MNSIIIPAYNEAKRINSTIKELLKLKGFELIFVVDGEDSTASIINHYKKKYSNIKFFFGLNNGKWGAIQYGFKKAKGSLVGFVDADLPVTLSNIKQGFNLAKKHEVVIGSRNIKGSDAKRNFLRNVYSRLFNLYVKILYHLPFNDTQCGFKVFNKLVLKKLFPLKSSSWESDVILLFKAKKQGLNIFEMPVNWREVSGSKLKLKSMILMIVRLFKLRFSL